MLQDGVSLAVFSPMSIGFVWLQGMSSITQYKSGCWQTRELNLLPASSGSCNLDLNDHKVTNLDQDQDQL